MRDNAIDVADVPECGVIKSAGWEKSGVRGGKNTSCPRQVGLVKGRKAGKGGTTTLGEKKTLVCSATSIPTPVRLGNRVENDANTGFKKKNSIGMQAIAIDGRNTPKRHKPLEKIGGQTGGIDTCARRNTPQRQGTDCTTVRKSDKGNQSRHDRVKRQGKLDQYSNNIRVTVVELNPQADHYTNKCEFASARICKNPAAKVGPTPKASHYTNKRDIALSERDRDLKILDKDGYCYLNLFSAVNEINRKNVWNLWTLSRKLGAYPLVRDVLQTMLNGQKDNIMLPKIYDTGFGMLHVNTDSISLLSDQLIWLFSDMRIGSETMTHIQRVNQEALNSGVKCDLSAVAAELAVEEVSNVIEGCKYMEASQRLTIMLENAGMDKNSLQQSALKMQFLKDGPIVDSLTATMVNKSPMPTCVLRLFLSGNELEQIHRHFKDVKTSYTPTQQPDHAFARTIKDILVHKIIYGYCGYTHADETPGKYLIVDIGGNYTEHVHRPAVHSCAPIMSLRDSARETTRELNLVQKHATVDQLKMYKNVEDLPNRPRCRKLAQNCKVPAIYGISVHSAYDMEISDFLATMDSHDLRVCYIIMHFVPEMLTSALSGSTECGMKWVKHKRDGEWWIQFDFHNESTIGYSHHMENYFKYFTRTIFMTPANRPVVREVIWSGLGEVVLKFVRCIDAPMTNIERNHFSFPIGNVGDKVFITGYVYRKRPYIGLGSHLDLTIKKKLFVVDKVFYTKMMNYCTRSDSATFNLTSVSSAATAYASKITINGQDILTNNVTMSHQDFQWVVLNIYLKAYTGKYEMGQIAKLYADQQRDLRNSTRLCILDVLKYAAESMFGAKTDTPELSSWSLPGISHWKNFVNKMSTWKEEHLINVNVEEIGAEITFEEAVVFHAQFGGETDVCTTRIEDRERNTKDAKAALHSVISDGLAEIKKKKYATNDEQCETLSVQSGMLFDEPMPVVDNTTPLVPERVASCASVCSRRTISSKQRRRATDQLVKKVRELGDFNGETEKVLRVMRSTTRSKHDCHLMGAKVINIRGDGLCVYSALISGLGLTGLDAEVFKRIMSQHADGDLRALLMKESTVGDPESWGCTDAVTLVSKIFRVRICMHFADLSATQLYSHDDVTDNTNGTIHLVYQPGHMDVHKSPVNDQEIRRILVSSLYSLVSADSSGSKSRYDKYGRLHEMGDMLNRSAYKLLDIIDQEPGIMSKDGRTLDVGGAPGGFVQLLSTLRRDGVSVSLGDYSPKVTENVSGWMFHCCDFLKWNTDEKFGHVFCDLYRPQSFDRFEGEVYERVLSYVEDGGSMLFKVAFYHLSQLGTLPFQRVVVSKPVSSKPANCEVYVLATNKGKFSTSVPDYDIGPFLSAVGRYVTCLYKPHLDFRRSVADLTVEYSDKLARASVMCSDAVSDWVNGVVKHNDGEGFSSVSEKKEKNEKKKKPSSNPETLKTMLESRGLVLPTARALHASAQDLTLIHSTALEGEKKNGNTAETSITKLPPQEIEHQWSNGLAHKGMEIMKKMGYKPGDGLGKDSQGRFEPVASSGQLGRAGIGMEVDLLSTNPFRNGTILVDEVQEMDAKAEKAEVASDMRSETSSETANTVVQRLLSENDLSSVTATTVLPQVSCTTTSRSVVSSETTDTTTGDNRPLLNGKSKGNPKLKYPDKAETVEKNRPLRGIMAMFTRRSRDFKVVDLSYCHVLERVITQIIHAAGVRCMLPTGYDQLREVKDFFDVLNGIVDTECEIVQDKRTVYLTLMTRKVKIECRKSGCNEGIVEKYLFRHFSKAVNLRALLREFVPDINSDVMDGKRWYALLDDVKAKIGVKTTAAGSEKRTGRHGTTSFIPAITPSAVGIGERVVGKNCYVTYGMRSEVSQATQLISTGRATDVKRTSAQQLERKVWFTARKSRVMVDASTQDDEVMRYETRQHKPEHSIRRCDVSTNTPPFREEPEESVKPGRSTRQSETLMDYEPIVEYVDDILQHAIPTEVVDSLVKKMRDRAKQMVEIKPVLECDVTVGNETVMYAMMDKLPDNFVKAKLVGNCSGCDFYMMKSGKVVLVYRGADDVFGELFYNAMSLVVARCGYIIPVSIMASMISNSRAPVLLRLIEVGFRFSVYYETPDEYDAALTIVTASKNATVKEPPKTVMTFPKLDEVVVGMAREPIVMPGDSALVNYMNAAVEYLFFNEVYEDHYKQDYRNLYNKCVTKTGTSSHGELTRRCASLYDNEECKVIVGLDARNHQFCFDGTEFVKWDEKKKKYMTSSRYVILSKVTELMLTSELVKGCRKIPKPSKLPYAVNFVQGAPGCGKTTFILDKANVSNVISERRDLVLSTTRAGADEIRSRLKQRYLKDNPDFDDAVLRRDVRTVDSYLMHGKPADTYKSVYLDEALMVHAGAIAYVVEKSKCDTITLLGDKNQIPYIDRDRIVPIKYSDVFLFADVTEQRNTTYRCPVDVVHALVDKYPGLKTTNENVKTVSWSCSNQKPPFVSKTLYMTWTQADKAALLTYKKEGSSVLTIHEAQGQTFTNVIMFRGQEKELEIFNSEAHAIVAISRHTQKFTYYTPKSDALTKLVDKANTMSDAARALYSKIGYVPAEVVANTYFDTGVQNDKAMFGVLQPQTHNLMRPVTLRKEISTPTGEAPVTPVVVDGDIAFIQSVYDEVFPGCSHQQTDYQAIVEESDLSVVVDKLVINLECADIFKKKKTFDPMRAKLKTMQPALRDVTMRETLLAYIKRNGNAPQLASAKSAHELGRLMYLNFIASAVDPDKINMLHEYSNDVVEVNKQEVDKWLENQKPGTDKLATTDIPLDERGFNVFNFMIKRQVKPPLDRKALDTHAALQTIAYNSKDCNMVMCPIFNLIRDRIMSVLKEKIVLYSGMSGVDFDRRVTNIMAGLDPELLHKIENDFAKFDKSQQEAVYWFEYYLYMAFGMDPYLLEIYMNAHRMSKYYASKQGLAARVEWQRRSGGPTTWLGNTLFTLCVILATYDIDLIALLLVSGDDSFLYLYGVDKVDRSAMITDLFNLECKFLQYSSAYFCSKFIVQQEGAFHLMPDPIKFITKLGRKDIRNWAHLEEYRMSCCDSFQSYSDESLYPALSEAVVDRYGLKGVDLSYLFSLLYSYVSDPAKFASLFYFADTDRMNSDMNNLPSFDSVRRRDEPDTRFLTEMYHGKLRDMVDRTSKSVLQETVSIRGSTVVTKYQLKKTLDKFKLVIYAPPCSGKTTTSYDMKVPTCDTDSTSQWYRDVNNRRTNVLFTNDVRFLAMAKCSVAIVPSKEVFERRCVARGLNVGDHWYDDVLAGLPCASIVSYTDEHLSTTLLEKLIEQLPSGMKHLLTSVVNAKTH